METIRQMAGEGPIGRQRQRDSEQGWPVMAEKRIPTQYEKKGGKRTYGDADLRPLRQLPESEVINEDVYGVPYANETGMADRLLREARETLEATAPTQARIERQRLLPTTDPKPEGIAGKIGRYAKGMWDAATTSLHPDAELMRGALEEPLVYSDEDRWKAMNRAFVTGLGEDVLASTSPLGLLMQLSSVGRPIKATKAVASSLNALRPGVQAAEKGAAAAARVAEARELMKQGFSHETAGALSDIPISRGVPYGHAPQGTAYSRMKDLQKIMSDESAVHVATKGRGDRPVKDSLMKLFGPEKMTPGGANRFNPKTQSYNPNVTRRPDPSLYTEEPMFPPPERPMTSIERLNAMRGAGGGRSASDPNLVGDLRSVLEKIQGLKARKFGPGAASPEDIVDPYLVGPNPLEKLPVPQPGDPGYYEWLMSRRGIG